MANNGYRKKGRIKPPWSDLPIELIELILKHCNFSDQARLRSVCRRWKSVGKVQPLKQLPWLMAYDYQNWSRCKLFDPTYRKAYTVNMSTIKEYYQEQKRPYIHICSSKFGWLLLSHPANQSFCTAFVLYSPFVNRMIELPNLQNAPYKVIATFSADPTSADCVFFVMHTSIHPDTVSTSTCRRGDTNWTTYVFPGSFRLQIDNVVYSEGLFWCATAYGRLASFSVAQGIWNVLQSPAPLDQLRSHYVPGGTYLVESNGNLLLVFISHKVRHVFKLDRSQMPWIWVEYVGDHTLFLGPTSLFVPAAVAGKSVVSGKIHYRLGSNCRFFSRNGKRSYSYLKHYGLLAIEEKELSEIWIETPSQ